MVQRGKQKPQIIRNNLQVRKYRVLTRNLILLVVVISLLPLMLTGAIILHEFQVAYKAKVYDHLSELVQKHSQNIDIFLNDRLGDIRVLARSSDISQLTSQEYLRNKLQLLREEYGGAFVDLGVVNEQGIQLAYAGPFNLAMADYSQAQWFKHTLNSEHYISDVFEGLRGTPHFIVAVRKNCQDRCVIIKATIDFEAFTALVRNIRIGATGFAFILNLQGQFQTKPPFDVILSRGFYFDLLKGRVEPGRIVEVHDALGRQTIFAVAPLKGGQWFLCVQQSASDAFAYLRTTERLALTIFAVISVLVVAVGFLVSRRMVSHIASADKERAAMSDKVVEAGRLASIGELAAGIAHEINNPVAIMVEEAGWIQDLLDEGVPDTEEGIGEIKRAVKQIRTQGSRCKEITHKLLSFARKTDPTMREINLNELVEEVIGLMGQKTRYANVQIVSELAEDLPPISASPSEMQQVLLNLLNNAVDSIDQGGGTVTVRTRLADNGSVLLEVQDTGIGIAEANLSRIFDPFYTTKPVGQGTGLGLSICYGIINKLGGDISVRSAKQQGTTFTVNLPRPKESVRAGQGQSGDSAS